MMYSPNRVRHARWKFLNSVLKSLKGREEAVLAFGMAVLAFGLLMGQNDPATSVGVPGAFYVLYVIRMWFHDRHRERLAEMDIRTLEFEEKRSLSLRAARRDRMTGSGQDTP